jgi:divalent metal cation (Fe/Co/Zn/Cd) transporter
VSLPEKPCSTASGYAGSSVFTDSWTSFGVVAGLALVLLTRWKPFDPLLAIAVAGNILLSAGHLVWRSAVGLLDYSDPGTGRKIREKLDTICAELAIQYHGARFRTTGYRQIIEITCYSRPSPPSVKPSSSNNCGEAFTG